MVLRAQRACKTKLVQTDPDTQVKVSLSPSNFCYPKFRRMATYEHAIRQFGSANYTSTGYGERSHSDIKLCYPFTNKHGATAIDVQVSLEWCI